MLSSAESGSTEEQQLETQLGAHQRVGRFLGEHALQGRPLANGAREGLGVAPTRYLAQAGHHSDSAQRTACCAACAAWQIQSGTRLFLPSLQRASAFGPAPNHPSSCKACLLHAGSNPGWGPGVEAALNRAHSHRGALPGVELDGVERG